MLKPAYGHEGGFLQTFTSKDHYIDTLADALGDDRETAIAFHEFLERDGFPTTNDRGEWFAVWNALDSADWQKLLERFERGV